jgi:diguanylate cyclase (GGDEF)-like protein/PAS domain S-box-containing protein
MPISHLGLEAHQPAMPADITQRLTAEEQAGFFYTLVDAAGDAIIAHRPDGSVVYANEAAVKLLGYDSPSELLELPPYGWIGTTHLQAAPRRIERILSDGGMDFESEVRRRDGVLIPTEVRTRRIDTPLGSMMIAVIRDISERVENRAALEYLAYHDGLTDLSNRIHFDDRLALAIADARRYEDTLALAYIDLDRFKPVNDRFGHAAGDDVLIEVARRLRLGVREQDTVARLGGDEFVVLFPRLSSQGEVELITQRLVGRIMEHINVGGEKLLIGASIGIAIFDPAVDDPRSLLVKADTAMYNAKLDPKHPWLVYHTGMELPLEFGLDHFRRAMGLDPDDLER